MKKSLLLVLSLMLSGILFAQQSSDPVIFEIGGSPIYKSEFMKEFLRSVGKDPAAAPTACTYEKRKALEDYVELFVNFRTKLTDAYALGFDTTVTLRNELATYRSELAAPYLIDSASMMDLLHEAYERNHYAIHAAHILIKCPTTASPEDTLAAYRRADSIYQRVTVGGEDFATVATELTKAELEEKRMRPHGPLDGDLGCFTAFDMVYPFENAVYTMQPGQISKPIRTRFGYHIIKLYERVPYYGRTSLRHIWLSDEAADDSDRVRNRIYALYKRLQSGEDFARVARNNSDDKSSGRNGGLLADLALNQMPPMYVNAIAKGLQEGEFTEPFHSQYGWHIILLEKRDTMPSFEELLPYYKQRLSRDQRNGNSRDVFISNMKQKYGFNDFTQEYVMQRKGKKMVKTNQLKANLDNIKNIVADSIFVRRWVYDSTMMTDTTTICRVGNLRYTQHDFARWLATHQKTQAPYDLRRYVDTRYADFLNAMVSQYADDQLESENEEFRQLVEEYRHGLMIFAYNDRMVWSQAILDTAGFDRFYASRVKELSLDNPDDSVYFWNTRARVTVYSVSDSTILPISKTTSIIRKGLKKGWNSNEVVNRLRAKCDTSLCSIASRLEVVEEGHPSPQLYFQWEKNCITVEQLENGKSYRVILVEDIINPMLKTQQEARGYYINDYQNYLEQQLVSRLRNAYNVTIHQDVIDAITY